MKSNPKVNFSTEAGHRKSEDYLHSGPRLQANIVRTTTAWWLLILVKLSWRWAGVYRCSV